MSWSFRSVSDTVYKSDMEKNEAVEEIIEA